MTQPLEMEKEMWEQERTLFPAHHHNILSMLVQGCHQSVHFWSSSDSTCKNTSHIPDTQFNLYAMSNLSKNIGGNMPSPSPPLDIQDPNYSLLFGSSHIYNSIF